MLAQRLVPLLDPAPAGGMTLSLSPNIPIVAYNPASGASFDSASRTVNISGGTGPYVISWDPGNGSIVTNSPSSATTSWHYHGHGIASYDEIVCTCTVRDSAGHVAYISQDVYMQAGGEEP